jgi:hypothetical protein
LCRKFCLQNCPMTAHYLRFTRSGRLTFSFRNSSCLTLNFICFIRASELVTGVRSAKNKCGYNELSFIDDGVVIVASLLPIGSSFLQRFVVDQLLEEHAQSSRPLSTSSSKQLNAIDHQSTQALQTLLNCELNKHCDDITDALLARTLLETLSFCNMDDQFRRCLFSLIQE